MNTNTIAGYYGGLKKITCDIYTYEKDGGTWYAVHGSDVVNFTAEEVGEGVWVEELSDDDTLTWDKPIKSEEDLQNAVDDGEEEDPFEEYDRGAF